MRKKNLGKLRKRAENFIPTKEKPADKSEAEIAYEAELRHVIRGARKNKNELERLAMNLLDAGVQIDEIKVVCYGCLYNAEMKEGKIKINNLGKAQQTSQTEKKHELITPKRISMEDLQKKLDACFIEQQPKNDGTQKSG